MAHRFWNSFTFALQGGVFYDSLILFHVWRLKMLDLRSSHSIFTNLLLLSKNFQLQDFILGGRSSNDISHSERTGEGRVRFLLTKTHQVPGALVSISKNPWHWQIWATGVAYQAMSSSPKSSRLSATPFYLGISRSSLYRRSTAHTTMSTWAYHIMPINDIRPRDNGRYINVDRTLRHSSLYVNYFIISALKTV